MKYERLTKSNYDINKIAYPSMVEYKRMFQTLAELEDKIEQRTLIELPCKVGDKVYFIDEKKWCWEMIIAEIGILKKSIVYKIGNGRKELRYVYDEDLGKKWFLTKAEAEKRLKEMQE